MPLYKMDGKKGGKQKYRVRINYLDSMGKPRQLDRVAYGLEEAKALESELSKNTTEETSGRSLTVKELYLECAKSKQHEVRETTADKSRQVIENHILPTLGDVRISKLTLPLLQEWKAEINSKSLSLTMKKNIFSQFRAILNYGVRMEHIPRNPLQRIGNFKSSLDMGEDKKMDYYTGAEFNLFIKAAHDSAFKAEDCGDMREWGFYIFFMIAFYTGMRKGEINGLQWDDIDGEYISVKRSIAQKLKGGDRTTPPKNKSSIRTMQMPCPLILALNDHRQRCEQVIGFDEQKKICGFDEALRDGTIWNRNKEYAESAGIKKIRIHDFRHSHATLLANEGINIQEVARRLGHSKIEMTWNTYSHLYPREEERAIKILNKIV